MIAVEEAYSILLTIAVNLANQSEPKRTVPIKFLDVEFKPRMNKVWNIHKQGQYEVTTYVGDCILNPGCLIICLIVIILMFPLPSAIVRWYLVDPKPVV